jgi:hypothetical protein
VSIFNPRSKSSFVVVLTLIALLSAINIVRFNLSEDSSVGLGSRMTAVILYILFLALSLLTFYTRRAPYGRILQVYLAIGLLTIPLKVVSRPSFELSTLFPDLAWLVLYAYAIICIQFLMKQEN